MHAIIKSLMMPKKDAIGHQFFKEMKRAYTNLYYANSQKLGHVHTHQKMLIWWKSLPDKKKISHKTMESHLIWISKDMDILIV